jgi:hypothetical protein
MGGSNNDDGRFYHLHPCRSVLSFSTASPSSGSRIGPDSMSARLTATARDAIERRRDVEPFDPGAMIA